MSKSIVWISVLLMSAVSLGAESLQQDLVPVWIALKRVYPNEKLNKKDFRLQEINVSSGLAHEYRGNFLSKDADLNQLEARQSILEGGFVLSSGVQKTPDIRRGEAVQIRMISGGVVISLSGTAEEPAYLDQPVRVMTQQTKKSLLGKLGENHRVEVQL